MITIRKETSGDSQQMKIVIQSAFGQTEEADIVDKLRRNCPKRISLVAVSADQIVGFLPASRYGIRSEYENVPDEAFMILVLDQAALESVSGIAQYRPEFSSAL
jgi:predicted N-acetyltransferase YhbS